MTALPISAAAAALAAWVSRRSRCTADCDSPHRAAVRVRLDQGGALAWLRAQPVQQKLYFRDRFAHFEVAAAGFLVCARGVVLTEAEHARLFSLLSGPDMRMYGALRFDDGALRGASPPIVGPWAPYEGYIFVLPAVELLRDASGRTHLAVNMLRASDAPQLLRVLRVLRPAPRALHTIPAAFMMPVAQTVENTVQFPDWDASMRSILHALDAEQYQKIVLARGKRFSFDPRTRQDPVQILAALDESNSRQPGRAGHLDRAGAAVETDREAETDNAADTGGGAATSQGSSSYLFCLQLDDHRAFLGCTPERLFRLRGSEIHTNAIAGTVRRDRENEGAMLRELWGRKNVAEHNFVVDHIRTALNGLGARVRASPTKVLPLPRLMHLSTIIVGLLDVDGNGESDAGTAARVFRLLKSMHPTPAVCGMPRERTLHELAKIEKFDRGLFAGPFGWFSRNESEFCVAIRSAIVSGNTVTAFAGSGIVQGSESRSEWDETELKMSAFTDLFTGDQGVRNGRKERGDRRTRSVITAGNGARGASQGDLAVANGISGRSFAGQMPGNSGESASHPPAPNGLHSAPEVMPAFDCSKLPRESNLNALWGCAAIEELCRNGIDTFFVAPGSRSAPLAIGVVRSPHANLYVVHDERSAGFLAVGFARATGRAAAIITSSGTAVANLMPAVVEAHMDNLPLILLTADRPPELRDIGANQTINQVNMFGAYVRWFSDMPCPTDQIPLRKLVSDVDYAVHMSGSLPLFNLSADAMVQDCGPVHMNFMFREYLAPIPQPWTLACLNGLSEHWTQSVHPVTVYNARIQMGPSLVDTILNGRGAHAGHVLSRTVQDLFTFLDKRFSGVIVAGGGPGSLHCEEDRLYINILSEELGWPVVADIGSGVRLDKECSNLVTFADQILVSSNGEALLEPQVMVQFGERLVSKRIAKMMTRASGKGEFIHILVSPRQKRCDQALTVTHRLQCTASDFIASWYTARNVCLKRFLVANNENCSPKCVSEGATKISDNCASSSRSKSSQLLAVSSSVDDFLKSKMKLDGESEILEPWLARSLVESITYPCALYIGNSMPIRDIDMFASANEFSSSLRIGANRGASGIDGVVSSGIGFGLGLGLPSVIVVGDMSLLHDMNALHFLRTDVGEQKFNGKPVTIVVVNNGGGAIFSMLPIAAYNSVFSPVFDTPHSVGFSSLARLFQLEYMSVKSLSEVRRALARPAARHRLIEAFVSSDHKENASLHKQIAVEISSTVTAYPLSDEDVSTKCDLQMNGL